VTSQPVSRALSQELNLECVDRHGRTLALVARFGYDESDPYAVWITFPSADGDVRWAICRATLLLGLTDPAGEGDLQLWPSTDSAGRAVVVLDFHSPDGHLMAQARTQDVYRFLTRTLATVPAGTEGDHLDLDALVADLLGGSHPQ
jgi:sporulation and cell division protein SsgA